jgi:hypothetical protein
MGFAGQTSASAAGGWYPILGVKRTWRGRAQCPVMTQILLRGKTQLSLSVVLGCYARPDEAGRDGAVDRSGDANGR